MVEGSVFNCMGLNIFQLIFIIAEKYFILQEAAGPSAQSIYL